jgi:hypothetical protein
MSVALDDVNLVTDNKLCPKVWQSFHVDSSSVAVLTLRVLSL